MAKYTDNDFRSSFQKNKKQGKRVKGGHFVPDVVAVVFERCCLVSNKSGRFKYLS